MAKHVQLTAELTAGLSGDDWGRRGEAIDGLRGALDRWQTVCDPRYRLTKRQSQIVEMILWQGLSALATAKALGLHHKTVQQHYGAAMGKLRAMGADTRNIPATEGQQ